MRLVEVQGDSQKSFTTHKSQRRLEKIQVQNRKIKHFLQNVNGDSQIKRRLA